MPGYTKLFNSILASTVWRAPDHTRLVWITMLAMADRHGIVEASIPGLADFARVKLHDCEQALAELAAPDPYSRSKECEGRRIEPVDGGWRLINHGKWRAKMSADERRDYLKLKQRESRARRQHGRQHKVDGSTLSTHTEAAPEAKAEKNKISRRAARSAHPDVVGDYAARFNRFWDHYPNKKGKAAALKAWTKLHPSEALTDVILAALEQQKRWPEWVKDGGQFVPHPATWLNRGSWDDEPYATMTAYEQPRAKTSLDIINDARRADGRPLLKP